MPTVHGENAVLRVLDKESMSEKFTKSLSLDVVGFAAKDLERFQTVHQRAIRHGAGDWAYRIS